MAKVVSSKKLDQQDPGKLKYEVVELLGKSLENFCPTETKSFKITGSMKLDDIKGVLSVSHAVLHAHSLTRLLSDTSTDITPSVEECLDPVSGVLKMSELKLPATWRAGSHDMSITYRTLPTGNASKEKMENFVKLLGFSFSLSFTFLIE